MFWPVLPAFKIFGSQWQELEITCMDFFARVAVDSELCFDWTIDNSAIAKRHGLLTHRGRRDGL